MASVVPKQSTTSSTASTRDAANEPLLDYIRQSAKSIQRTELTVGLLSWLVMGLGTIFIFVLIDHWVLPFNGIWRYAVWLFLMGGSLIWLALRVAPLIGRSINPEYAAKRIEDTIPEMKDGLISWLQLSSRESTPRGVLNAVGRYVAKHLQGQEVASVIDQFASMKLAAILFGMTLISAIYLAVSPKSGIATISRLIMPWADIAPSTRVQILSLTPGNATVTEGSNLQVSLQVRGWLQGDVAQIRFATDDGQTVDQLLTMQADIEGFTYSAELGKSFGGLAQPMHYFVEAGDAKAGPFAVRIQAVPLVLLERVEYAYPAYMRLAPRITEGDGRIEAPEGTRVTVYARSNQGIKKARIEFDRSPDKDSSFRVVAADDVTIEDRSITASLLLQLDEVKSNPSLMNYRIRSENERGEENVEPVVYPIKVIPDLAPEVQLASDLKDAIDLPVNQRLDLEVRAMDPDFGLMRLSISGMVDNQNVITKELFRNEQGVLAQTSEVYVLDPSMLRLRPGMQVELFALAQDNRRAAGSDQSEPNIRQSRIVQIRITPPSEVPANASADKNSQTDPKSSNKNNTENGKPEKDKGKNPAQDNPAKNDAQNPKSKEPDKGGDKNDRKPSGKDGNEKPNKSSDTGKSEAPSKSNPPDQAGNQPQNANQPNEPQQNSPDNADQKSSPDPKQGQQGQEGQSSDPSGQEKSDNGQQGSGQQGGGEKQQGAGKNQQGGGASGGPEGGNESPTGQESSSGNRSSGSKSQPSKGAGQRGDSVHDGEAFEELQDALQQEEGERGDTKGEGKSTNRPSTENNQDSSSKSSDTPSENGKPSGEDSSKAAPKSSDNDPRSAGKPSASESGAEKNGSSPPDPAAQNSEPLQGSESNNQREKGDKTNPQGPSGKESGKGSQENTAKQGQGEKRETQPHSGKSGTESGNPLDAKPPNSNEEGGLPNTNSINGKGNDDSNAGKSKASPNSGEKEGGKSEQARGKEAGNSESEQGKQGTGDNASNTSAKNGQGVKQGKADQGSPSAQSQGKQGQASDQPSDSQKGSESSSKSGKSSKDSTGNKSGKSRPGNDDPSSDVGSVPPANTEQAEAEVEYARQATDMVLKALDRQRDQPDPELLKRMGWNKEQLQAFLDRWKQARDQAATNPQKKHEYDESLRSLGLMPNTQSARNEKGNDDRLRGLNEEGSRVRPPESLREHFEAFRKSTK